MLVLERNFAINREMFILIPRVKRLSRNHFQRAEILCLSFRKIYVDRNICKIYNLRNNV